MENNLTTSLKGLNTLICGATSGIGKATAIEFSNLGANITLFARNEKKLESVFKSMECSDNQGHSFLVGDFNSPDNIQSVIINYISNGNSLSEQNKESEK